MPAKSASKIITRDPSWLGPAIPPGEILLEEFLKPMSIGQVEAARRLGISLNRLNEIITRQARHHGRYGSASRAPVEDLGAVLDDFKLIGICIGRCNAARERRREKSDRRSIPVTWVTVIPSRKKSSTIQLILVIGSDDQRNPIPTKQLARC